MIFMESKKSAPEYKKPDFVSNKTPLLLDPEIFKLF